MPHPGQDPPSDTRLESLLQIERDLEARVRAAELHAHERVTEAREATTRVDDELREALEEEGRREEEQALEAHRAELLRLTEDAGARVARLASVPEAVVERLARRVYASVIAGGGST